MQEYGLPAYDAGILTSTKELADFFESCLSAYPNPKAVSNWVMGELSRLLNASGMDITACKIKPSQLGSLLQLIDEGTISGKIAKTVFEEMFASGKDPGDIIEEKD